MRAILVFGKFTPVVSGYCVNHLLEREQESDQFTCQGLGLLPLLQIFCYQEPSFPFNDCQDRPLVPLPHDGVHFPIPQTRFFDRPRRDVHLC